jgi:hypothetical protein
VGRDGHGAQRRVHGSHCGATTRSFNASGRG